MQGHTVDCIVKRTGDVFLIAILSLRNLYETKLEKRYVTLIRLFLLVYQFLFPKVTSDLFLDPGQLYISSGETNKSYCWISTYVSALSAWNATPQQLTVEFRCTCASRCGHISNRPGSFKTESHKTERQWMWTDLSFREQFIKQLKVIWEIILLFIRKIILNLH